MLTGEYLHSIKLMNCHTDGANLNKETFMSGMGDKLSGKAKQAAGKATDNKKLQAEGKAQEMQGHAKDKMAHAETHMSDKMAEHKRRHKG